MRSRTRTSRSRAPGAVRGGIARDWPSVLFGGARRRRRVLRSLALLAAVGGIAAAVAITSPSDARPPSPDAGPAPAGSPAPSPEPTPHPGATPAPTGGAAFAPAPPPDDGQGWAPGPRPAIAWRRSRAVGLPWSGKLRRGVQLPAEGPDWFTWDNPRGRSPNRGWRLWGTDALIRTTLRVLREYREADPLAPRVGVGDLSRPRGGDFGKRFGGLGHASHQNGLDIDVLYPRKDLRERRPLRPAQVDRRRAQALVDAWVAAGAEKVFVGPSLRLRGPRDVVVPLVHHDDHLHARIAPPPR